jgi:hypothetical protein
VYNTPPAEESEDCLYLNVFAPASPAPGRGRPVLVWFYGGSLQFGHAGQGGYDGSSFATYQDVIVVTTNYRTNGMRGTDRAEDEADHCQLQFLAFPAHRKYLLDEETWASWTRDWRSTGYREMLTSSGEIQTKVWRLMGED